MSQPCECGCGEQATNRFVVGHNNRQNPEDRFWSKVRLRPGDACWDWTDTPTRRGYGRLRVGKAHVHAHRFAYELLVGPIPEGLQLDHLCRNRLCVNPAHLEPVTARENLMRGETLAAKNAAKTHCFHGHEYTPENTYMGTEGRACRTCRRRWDRERKDRLKSQRRELAEGGAS